MEPNIWLNLSSGIAYFRELGEEHEITSVNTKLINFKFFSRFIIDRFTTTPSQEVVHKLNLKLGENSFVYVISD